MPQQEGTHLGECLAHCKAQDFVGWIKGCKNGWSNINDLSYDVLLHKEMPFGGCDVTAPQYPFRGKIPQKPPFAA